MKETIVRTTGYAAAVRRGNDHAVFDLHPRVYGRRKELVAAFPHVLRNKQYRIVRVNVTKWVQR